MTFTTSLRASLATVLVVSALGLVGCGGGGGGGAPTVAPPTGFVPTGPVGAAVNKSIGAAGGSMEISSQGILVTLSVPPGALAADTALTVTPVTPSPGESVRLVLQPAGLVFNLPVTVTLLYPEGQQPGVLAGLVQSLGSGNTFILTERNAAARTLTAQLVSFGGTLQPLAQGQAQPRGVVASASSSLIPRAFAQEEALSPDGGTLSANENLNTAALVTHVRRLIAVATEPEFEVVLDLQLTIASILQRRVTDPAQAPEVNAFLADAHDTACRLRTRAIEKARTTPLVQPGDFRLLVQQILYWDAIAKRLGGSDCAGISALDAAHEVIQRELTLLKVKFPAATTPAEITPPANEVRDARVIKEQARTLQNTDPSGQALNLNPFAAALQDELISPAQLEARKAAWKQAKATASLAHHVPLINAFGANSLLQQDAQYIRTAISITAKSAGGNVMASAQLGTSPSEVPVDPVRSASINARNVNLEIGGNVGVLHVAGSGSENLRVTFDGVEVAKISSSGDVLMGNGQTLPTFSSSGLLAAAGLPAGDTGTHTLRILRTDSANALRLGITDDVLATVTLNFGEVALSATFAGTLVEENGCKYSGKISEPIGLSVIRNDAVGSAGRLVIDRSVFLAFAPGIGWVIDVVISGDLATNAQVSKVGGEWTLNIRGNSAELSNVGFIDQCGGIDGTPGVGGRTSQTFTLTRQ